MADLARILPFQEHRVTSGDARDRFAREGFEVTLARSFVDAVPHLAPGRSDVLLVYLPETEFVRNTFLLGDPACRAGAPVVEIAEVVTDELRRLLERFGVATVLPARAPWHEVLRTIRETLAADEAGSTKSNQRRRNTWCAAREPHS